jgi:hypothetical protein
MRIGFMDNMNKGISPFYPERPVPVEFFAGRENEIKRIKRAIGQVELGKSQNIFLTGEYGIGKSSLAGVMKYFAEAENNIMGIHVFLGNAKTVDEVAIKTVEAAIKTKAYEHTRTEKIRNFLSKYIVDIDLFGFAKLNSDALKADGPNFATGYLPFLHGLLNRVKDTQIKGLMVILDEINGITKNQDFAYFIKCLVDENALSNDTLPLLLILCGVKERRWEMIKCHQPIDRIFDIVDINTMNELEMKNFFYKTFHSVGIAVNDDALNLLCIYSAGFPKIMHIIGDNIFWIDQDNLIDKDDASKGILAAAEEIGKKFVDQHVLKALRSKDYHSILSKVTKGEFSSSFQAQSIAITLTEVEKKKFNNFLQRMKELKVISSGDEKGEWIFNSVLVRLYLHLKSLEKN